MYPQINAAQPWVITPQRWGRNAGAATSSPDLANGTSTFTNAYDAANNSSDTNASIDNTECINGGGVIRDVRGSFWIHARRTVYDPTSPEKLMQQHFSANLTV